MPHHPRPRYNRPGILLDHNQIKFACIELLGQMHRQDVADMQPDLRMAGSPICSPRCSSRIT